MSSSKSEENDFLNKLTEIIEANITNPQFGVSVLAKEMGMSRSNLHRKVNELTKLTVSQYMNQVRLKKAKEILRHTSDTVSEVAYKVGYNNVSYFIKCFHEYYGYSPGQVGNREEEESDFEYRKRNKRKRLLTIAATVLLFVILIVIAWSILKPKLEKTIAILPPEYLAADSSYTFQLDGTVMMIIDNLTKLSNMKKVEPWLSVKQYRNTTKTAREIARELDVNYLCTTSASIIGDTDTIRLSFDLIEGKEGNQVWNESFNVNTEEFIKLPGYIAQNIANNIDVIITPEEQKRIDKKPTENEIAHNLYLKAIEKSNTNRQEAIRLLEESLEHDNEFALAYAQLAWFYCLQDVNRAERIHLPKIRNYAERAILYDSELDRSWIAKYLVYLLEGEYEMADQYLKKALVFNPNSSFTYVRLSVLYNWYLTDLEKALEYALKAFHLGYTESDSIKRGSVYANLARLFMHTGFFNEAEYYNQRALELNPKDG
ncbi:MAG: helix-turn-helix domain-containing protein, partial [Draconibacterium sp.]|nr:helix-turn-helix domain-containing protein [Draconibacterium sp.]